MAAAIRVERAGAEQGEFFTPPLARLLRARIDAALTEGGFTADDVLATQDVEGVNYAKVRLRVNDTLGVPMFPCVVTALPELPPELQYRIVGEDLLLIDVHASLVVDILPSVLIDATPR